MGCLLLVAVVVQAFALERVEGCGVGEVAWRQGSLGHVAVAVGLSSWNSRVVTSEPWRQNWYSERRSHAAIGPTARQRLEKDD